LNITTTTTSTTPTTAAKDNGVTTLTFWGHVTSVVTCFDSRWSTSYGWSIATMRLSGTVIEIWRLKVHVHMTSHLISSNVHFVHLAEIISTPQSETLHEHIQSN